MVGVGPEGGYPQKRGEPPVPPVGRGPSRRLKAVVGRPLSPAVGPQGRGGQWGLRGTLQGLSCGCCIAPGRGGGGGMSHPKWLKHGGLCTRGFSPGGGSTLFDVHPQTTCPG